MITCAKCGRANEDHFKFCLGCGGNLEEQRAAAAAVVAEPVWPAHCPSCGAPVQPGQRFCGSCGGKIDPIVPSISMPPGPPPSAAPVPATSLPPSAVAPAPAAPSFSGPAPAQVSMVGAVAQLVMVMPDNSAGPAFPLVAGENIIGRETGFETFRSDERLSPRHAAFSVEGGRIKVRDLNSLNGVFRRLSEPTELHDGDMLRIGQELLVYRALSSLPRIVSSPDDTAVSGSPLGGAWGLLERISAPEEASIVFALRGEEQSIGREQGQILFRDDGYVSGRHARIFQREGRVFIEDVGSSNGTFLRIKGEAFIESGRRVLMGSQPYTVALV